jgi:GAF domain-containing protein
MFGATEDELRRVGRHGLSGPDHPAWRSHLAERRRKGSVRGIVPMFRLDGTPLLIEASSGSFVGPDGCQRTFVIVRDVTERVRMERRLVAYDEITEALLSGAETAQVLEVMARHACSIFDATFACISTPAETGVVIAAAYGAGATLVGQTVPPGGLAEQVMTSRRPLLVAQINSATRRKEMQDLDLGPGMLTPIMSGDTALGALCVGTRPGRHPYGTDDLDVAIQYGARAGVVLALGQARAQAERRQERTNRQLQQALDTRLVVERAKGFLAGCRDIDTDEAFDRIRKYSRSHNADIHLIARQVLDRKLLL